MLLGYAIDWAAWATFSTGLLAVAGAVIIGRKQLGITARQAEISDRQTQIQQGQLQLQQLGLRVAIFERRMRVFETTGRYVARVRSDASVTDDEGKDFVIAVAEARFLFTDPTWKKLQDWSDKCRALRAARKSAPKGDDGKVHETPEIAEIVQWMNEEGTPFLDIFQDEMTLSDISMPVGQLEPSVTKASSPS